MSFATLTADNSTAAFHEADKKPANWLSSWHAIVTVSGITFGGLIVVMVLAFLCYHRVAGGRSVGSGRRPRKTQVGQAVIRPLVGMECLSHDGSVTFCDDIRGSPTRSYLLAAYRTSTMPGGRKSRDAAMTISDMQRKCGGEQTDGKFVESDVDVANRYCQPYKLYGFPCATYSGPAAVDEPATGEHAVRTYPPFSCHQLMYEQPMCHPYHAVTCANCSLRRSQSPTCSGCSVPFAAAHSGTEVFVDGPPAAFFRHQTEGRTPKSAVALKIGDHDGVYQSGNGVINNKKRRPPVDGSDSEMTPVLPRVRSADKGTGSKVMRPDSPGSAMTSRHRETNDRPDGQSPSDTAGPESLDDSMSHRLAASTGTLADISGANNDLEYDDIPMSLPGSYFEMDPQAYTLTWSKQPPPGATRMSSGPDG